MHATTKAILDDNKGREPERLRLKFRALRSDAYAFFRGTAALFYRSLPKARVLTKAPATLACGDLHLENFGSYKGDNRLVYFDLNDFDEACVAPIAFELTRFITSIYVSAKPLKIGDKQAAALIQNFLDIYCAALQTTKPRWVERASATGPVRALLQSLKRRHHMDLIARRTEQTKGKTRLIVDGVHALPTSEKERAAGEAILAAFARTQPDPTFYKPIDIARRIAGNGSLGLERYVALVRGTGGAEGRYLLDIKHSNASALAAALVAVSTRTQPRWASDAERVVCIQQTMQAIAPSQLAAVALGRHSYMIKELQAFADRVNLQRLIGKRAAFSDVVKTMAEVIAWAHLRGASRFGADSADALADYAGNHAWREGLVSLAQDSAMLIGKQWQAFAGDYDQSKTGLIDVAG
jgi:uncharacterized protein (DUF2252 family)